MKKDNKTTIVAILMSIAFLGLTTAYVFGKIDASGYGIALAAAAGFGSTLIGLFAADSKKRLND